METLPLPVDEAAGLSQIPRRAQVVPGVWRTPPKHERDLFTRGHGGQELRDLAITFEATRAHRRTSIWNGGCEGCATLRHCHSGRPISTTYEGGD